MSNIFNTNEMEVIVKRIEETYNVSGKKVKLTIEIIDEKEETINETSNVIEDDSIVSSFSSIISIVNFTFFPDTL